MRRKLVVGNWKMHGSNAATAELLGELLRLLPPLHSTDVAVCPPFVYLAVARQRLAGSAIKLGAQNVGTAERGAFTGEIAANMLRDCGCDFAIVGHSERRNLFAESNEQVAEKAAIALRHELIPIICVGESLTEREAGKTLDIIARQLEAIFVRFSAAELNRAVIAYEPVWAIGTGRTATPVQAQEVHAFIRQRLQINNAAAVPVLYGGSVKAENAKALFVQADIDGGLVGGASLNAEEFVAICRAAE